MAEAKPPIVRYHYLKSTAFRIVHADGVFGGPTPKGLVHLAFFSERFPLPQQTEHELARIDEGKAQIGSEIPSGRVSREGLVREVEVGVLMSPDVGRAFHKWLGEQLDKIDAIVAVAEASASDASDS